MTSVLERPVADASQNQPAPAPAASDATDPSVARRTAPLGPRRLAVVVVAWVLTTLLGVFLVLTSVSPLFQQRDQRSLLDDYRREIRQATNEAFGLPGTEVDTVAPELGAPVSIIDINGLTLRQVAVEGTGPQQTRSAPGHVVGTAGPGQPGNSVIVGRRNLYGGPFGDLGSVEEGDRILVTTTQGPSVYEVGHVGRHRIVDGSGEEADAEVDTDEGDAPLLPDGPVTTDQLYGPSEDDRLTLVTSASGVPTSSDEATVVVATMDGVPFAPTPQGGRTEGQDGRQGDPDAIAGLVLALLAYGGVVVAAVVAYRRVAWRSAYLLSAPPLLALTIVLAEQFSRLLPAWT